ncbi:hypothetical protein EDB89DRAFT_2082058 [Lactarius sanguifluus]|nr:hypothetical protein EDB89DRAFT_2082058 [Lactarius sanguifluus]
MEEVEDAEGLEVRSRGLEGRAVDEGSDKENDDPSEARAVHRNDARTVYELPEQLAEWYPAEHPFIITATDSDNPWETPYTCDTTGQPLYRGDVLIDRQPLIPTAILQRRLGSSHIAPAGYIHNRGDKFVHFPITDAQGVEMSTSDTREYEYSSEISEVVLVLDSYSRRQVLGVTTQAPYIQVVMNPDPIVLALAVDSDKTYSKPLYAEPHVRERGKPQYTPAEMHALSGGHSNQHRTDLAVNMLKDTSLKAELHRYRNYRTEAERLEQRLHALSEALGAAQSELARSKFRLEMADIYNRVGEVQEGWSGGIGPTRRRGRRS